MRIFENQKGISNLIATLILIAIAIVGGAFAYTVFRNQAQTTTTSADLQVQDLTVQDIGDTTYCSTTVKNVGSQQLTGITMTINPGVTGNISLSVGDLDPGQTGSADNDTGSLNAGQEYPVKITASTPGGGSITKTMTVRVKS